MSLAPGELEINGRDRHQAGPGDELARAAATIERMHSEGKTRSEAFVEVLRAGLVPGDRLLGLLNDHWPAAPGAPPLCNISGHPGSENVTQSQPNGAHKQPPKCENVTQEIQRSRKLRKPNEIQRDSAGRRRSTASATHTTVDVPNAGPRKEEAGAAAPLHLPFEDYLRWAVEEHGPRFRDPGDPEEAGAINAEHGWQSPGFGFIRLIKSHPVMRGADVTSAIRKVQAVFSRWRKALPKSKREGETLWSYFLGLEEEDLFAEFADAWEKVRYLAGRGPLELAVELADEKPLLLLDTNPHGWSLAYVRFISIAGWLQTAMGDRPIQLPVHDLAGILKVEPITVSRYRRWATEEGFLMEVAKHKFAGKGRKGKATEFRFSVERFPVLREMAQ